MEKLSWLPWRLPTHPLPLSWLIWVNPALHASWYSCLCFSLNTKLQPIGGNIVVEAALARTAADLSFSWTTPPLTFWYWIEFKAGNQKGGGGKCYQLKQYIRQNACSIDPAATSPPPAPPKTCTSMSSALSKTILRFFCLCLWMCSRSSIKLVSYLDLIACISNYLFQQGKGCHEIWVQRVLWAVKNVTVFWGEPTLKSHFLSFHLRMSRPRGFTVFLTKMWQKCSHNHWKL